jgi:hypothetical protein
LLIITGGSFQIAHALSRSTEIVERQIVLVSDAQQQQREVRPSRGRVELRRLRLIASPFVEAGFAAAQQRPTGGQQR